MKNPENPTGQAAPDDSASTEGALHWSGHKEQAAGYWQLKFVLVLFRILPAIVLRLTAFAVGFFYFIFSKRARTESRRFLDTAAPFIEDKKIRKKCRSCFGSLWHIISFSLSLIEKVQSWGGRFSFKNLRFHDDDRDELVGELEDGKGALLIFSHLGNSELLRGLLFLDKTGVSRSIHVTSIIDMKITAHFRRMLNELNERSSMDIIGGDEIGSGTAVLLEERLAAGGLVVITGDRTPASGGTNINIPFFGKDAPFPQGVFYLASLLNAPVYLIFGMRQKALSLNPKYDMYVHKSRLSFDCSRKERLQRSAQLAESFAAYLESYCKKQPFQWYNFYDFWNGGDKK